jgi:hypothetical protein
VHEKPGWLKDKLLSLNLLEATNEGLWKRVMSDYKCQLAGMEGMQFSMGESYKDPRETRGVQGGGGKFVSQRKESQLHVPWGRIFDILRSLCSVQNAFTQ